MTSFKACILFLVAAATAKAVVIPDNVSANPNGISPWVYFRNYDGDIWRVTTFSTCTKFPNWLHHSTKSSISSPITCMVFENSGCTGRGAHIYGTPNGDFEPVPDVGADGILSTWCISGTDN